MKSLPAWAERLLRAICPEELFEQIEGDLIELYNYDVKAVGKRKAELKFLLNSLRFFRPGILFRNKFSLESNLFAMLLNYFKMAGRHLMKDKTYSVINIIGLSVGILAFFSIIQYADFETSFEQFHTNKQNIYRVSLRRYENGELVNASAKSYAGVYDLLCKNIPEVKAASRVMKIPANTGALLKYNQKIYNEKGGTINVDTGFFKVFPSLLVRGDASDVLAKPNSLVISESVAKKIFGDADPIGQQLDQMNEDIGYPSTVTGIIRDIPDNSHFHAKFVGRLQEAWPDVKDWGASFSFNYVYLSEGTDALLVTKKLNQLMQRVAEDFPVTKGTELFLQPIESIHLKSQFDDEFELNGNQALLYALLAIALVIIVVAWINYVNIEIARFLRRSKEVGVRRVIGSGKINIVFQFLIEYLCLSFLSLLIAVLVLIFLSPQLSAFTGVAFHAIQWPLSSVVLQMVGFLLVGSLLVGVYPAFFLLKLNPVATLKGNLGGLSGGKGIRRSLMVVQFAASLFLIAFLFIVDDQLDFMRHTNKKIEIDKVITVLNPTAYADKEVELKHNEFKLLEQKLLQNASIQMVSTSSAIPGSEIGFTFVDLLKRKKDDPYDPTRFKTLFVGENFIPLYGLKLLAGRNFDISGEDWAEPWERRDWHKIILNEKAIRQLGFSSPEKAVNQIVKFYLWGDDFTDYEIIGVIEDYHHEAAKEEVLPMILSINYNSFQQVYYSIRLNKGAIPQDAISYIQKSWTEIFPDLPFEYFFLDDYYDRQFKSEMQFERIFSLFAGIALFLSCLGVFGTSLFEVNSRLKEISIRKVLGASVESLIALLSKDNMLMAILSFLVAGPAIYYLGNQWLSSYPIKIDFNFVFLLFPLILLVLIVLATSSFQIINGANSNPVDHLKNE